MTRTAPLFALALLAAPASALAQEHPGGGSHAAHAAPAARPAPPSRPAAPAGRPGGPAGAPGGGPRAGFAGYGAYERSFPGGVRSAPQAGGFAGARPGGFNRPTSGTMNTAPQAGAAVGVGAQGRGFDARRSGFGGEYRGGAAGYGAGAPQGDAARGAGGRDVDARGQGFGGARGQGYGGDGFARGRGDGGFGGARGGFSYRGREYARFHADPFRFPRGYSYRYYGRGQYLPRAFLYDSFFLNDYADFYLSPPPGPEYRWVRYGPDALLVDVDSGQVVDAAYGVFDDGQSYGAAPGYGADAGGYGYGADDGGAAARPYEAAPYERDGQPPYGDPRDGGQDGDGGYGPPPR